MQLTKPLERRSTLESRDESNRLETRRDRDRVLYSDAFRRLGGVTQVASSSGNIHNRLTHSLKVEQVGASLFTRLIDGEEPMLGESNFHAIQAACLAHDLGHPPFGHAGETALHEILTCKTHRTTPRPFMARQGDDCHECLLEDGFEGNAQTFRIITALEGHRTISLNKAIGLDMTRMSLAATSKYPWLRGGLNDQSPAPKANKWGAYDCDADALKWVFGVHQSDKTVEAELMDWADDISYAVHDIEDFYRMGLIPINDYRANTELLEVFIEYISDSQALGPQSKATIEQLEDLFELFPEAGFKNQAEDIAKLDLLRSRLITQFINASSLTKGPSLKRTETAVKLNAILKQLIWFHIIDSPDLARIQAGQTRVLKDIFEALLGPIQRAYNVGTGDTPREQDLRRLPTELRRAISVGFIQQAASGYSKNKVLVRALVDYMSSLSDAEAYATHSVLGGSERASFII